MSVFISSASSAPAQSPVPPPVYPLQAEIEATASLDRAIASLDPAGLPWLHTAVWQDDRAAAGVPGRGEVIKPDPHAAVLDLEVRCGRVKRTWHMICDGQAIWEIDGEGGKNPRWEKRLLPGGRPGERTTARPNALCLGTLVGPRELLEGLAAT